MKRSMFVLLALFLAIPAVSYAGSATSRWDMTLGGYVKFDVAYTTQAVGVDNLAAQRSSAGNTDSLKDETGNLTWADAETRLNWAVKGPDALGAKTSAFVEGDFRGRINSTEYGLFTLRHAYFQMIWPKTTLLVGHTWQAWGTIPSLSILAFVEEHFNKGATRVPQIRITHAFNPNFTGVFAIQAPYGTIDYGRSANIGYEPKANSLLPDFAGDISYASGACGNIGPFALKIGLGGFWGKDQYMWQNSAAAGTRYEKDKVDRWGAGFYWYIPVIPEKKGNKAGALAFTGQLFTGQGMGTYLPVYGSPASYGAYNRTNYSFLSSSTATSTTAMDAHYYHTEGGWIQATFYFTDKLFTNLVYGAQYNNQSQALYNAQTAGTGQIRRIQNAVVNLMYDLNPAIRFGLEYDWVTTAYGEATNANASNKGSFHSVRMGAYYFF